MQVSDLFRFKNREIKALHLTWIAFFMCFYVWFNMAPLASSMLARLDWLTRDDIRLFAIANVALTIPARIIVGMALDRFGPRRVFSVLMVLMAIPTFVFAFGDTREVLFMSRLVLSSIGASFVVTIHMVALWFPPRSIGFAEGFAAGWGNFGSAAAAMTLPTIALHMYGGADGWRWAIATSGAVIAAMACSTGSPSPTAPADTHKKPRKASALEVSSWGDLVLLCIFIVPLVGILSILVYRVQLMGYIDGMTAAICYAAIAVVVLPDRAGHPRQRADPEEGRARGRQVSVQVGRRAQHHLLRQLRRRTGRGVDAADVLPGDLGLSAVAAGLIASAFAFVNLFARPMGGLVSDRFGNRAS
jgi:MFS transporter, NNP family, nitrate/nitrite transporter